MGFLDRFKNNRDDEDDEEYDDDEEDEDEDGDEDDEDEDDDDEGDDDEESGGGFLGRFMGGKEDWNGRPGCAARHSSLPASQHDHDHRLDHVRLAGLHHIQRPGP